MTRLLTLIAPMLLAQISVAAEPDISTADSDAIRLSLSRGLDLYRYDQAAWHTTDAMLEDISDPKSAGVSGWVITRADDGFQTTFWKRDGDSFAGVYSAVWTGSEVTNRKMLSGDDSKLSAHQIELIIAKQAINTDGLTRCSDKPFNAVILPSEVVDGPITVYLLTPQTSLNTIPLGGHYRFSVTGGQVIGQRAFSKSCMELPIGKAEGQVSTPAGLFVTTLLDPVPTEIHVFSTFAAGIPLFVNTSENKHLWATEVSGGQPRIRMIR